MPNVKGEWIHPDNATVAEMAELAHQCPSGAIRCETKDEKSLEAPPLVNTVRLQENGPLAFHADLRIGQDEPQFRATLCRCGASSSKPYCDNSHAKVAFAATGEPATTESEPLSSRSGPLVIEPVPNGPLHLSGPVELVSGTGRTINRTTETWLCRCGHSANKPYCDGTHKKVGFQA